VCDTSLSIEARATALVDAMTLEEKVANVQNTASGVPRLGLPAYQWWNEGLHGVASSPGVTFQTPLGSNFSYATSFPMPILMSAAFDDLLINSVATIVSTEARAFYNFGYAGLDFWTPNINPFRDPRWGRGMETPGEDIYHIQNYVYNLVTGLQGGLDPVEKKVISTCKHFAAYDIEQTRTSNDLNPTRQDLSEFYLPGFKTCARDAKAGAIMCSYNAVDGIPSCASRYLLQEVLREFYNFSAPYNWVTSDCDAVDNIYNGHSYVSSDTEAAAVALNAGTDLDCGSTYADLTTAIQYNMTTEALLDQALTRLYSSLVQLGYFTPSEYTELGWTNVGTSSAQALALTAAEEGITLLKNDGILPLSSKLSGTVAVIGPWANATTQMQGNYQGTAPFLISPLSAFQSTWLNVVYEEGTAINSANISGFAAAISAADASDIIIYLGGIDTSVEAEGMDRSTIVWPGNQLALIDELAALDKPLVIVQFGGGQIDDSTLISNPGINALVWAGYPGQSGGTAVKNILTGISSPAGRLPITQYPAEYATNVSIFNMNLRPDLPSFPGRTYKWYDGTPVYPFGFGLHYTNFSFSWESTPARSYDIETLVRNAPGPYKENAAFDTVVSDIKNIGGPAGLASDYVGLLFISTKNGGPPPYPNKELVSYSRLHNIAVHSSQRLSLPLTLSALTRADTAGNLYIYPGDYTLSLDIDSVLTFDFSLTGQATLVSAFPQNEPDVVSMEYLGCYTDSINESGVGRTLAGAQPNLSGPNYPQLCADTCSGLGYVLSGVEHSR
jgi:xylan 1,4-beta-xylosidase